MIDLPVLLAWLLFGAALGLTALGAIRKSEGCSLAGAFLSGGAVLCALWGGAGTEQCLLLLLCLLLAASLRGGETR